MPAPESEPLESEMIDFLSAHRASREKKEFKMELPSNVDKVLLKRLSGSLFRPFVSTSYWFRLWIMQGITLASSVLLFLTDKTYPLPVVDETLAEVFLFFSLEK